MRVYNIDQVTELRHPYNKAGDGPEAPEIRTSADKLRETILNKIITNYALGPRAKATGFEHIQCPVTIIGVRSYAKKLIIDLSSQHMIISSFGMTGHYQYTQGAHSRIRFDIAEAIPNGLIRIVKHSFSLYFDDYRYFGNVKCIPNSEIPTYFSKLGPDLLQLALDEQTWIPLQQWVSIYTQKRLLKREVSDVLMDQDLVASIGNYLSVEILYYAGVNPHRLVETISLEEWDRIRINAHRVVVISYSYGGFTIESFISPDGSHGMYPAAVYGTVKNKPVDPLGNPIIRDKGKKRTCHWVPAIQK